jgi:hypothetical protein
VVSGDPREVADLTARAVEAKKWLAMGRPYLARGLDPTILPPELQAILDDLDRSDGDTRGLIGGLSDSQANWQPRETAWSISQCVDHLARANTIYTAALLAAVKDARAVRKLRSAPIQPGWISRIFIHALEPPPKRKLRAPKKIVPAAQISGEEALRAFLHSQEQVRTVIREGAWLDLNRIRFRNPFIGILRFTVGAGLLIIAAHNRRHLWQAEQVREAAGFPAN